MRRLWLMGVAAVLAAGGCDNPSPRYRPDTNIDPVRPGKCTELEDATRTWLGGTCEHGPELREVLAIGEGYVMDWTPRTKVARVWALSDDPRLPLGEIPVAAGPTPTLYPRTTLIPIGKRRLMLVQTDKTNVTIFTVSTTGRQGDHLVPSLGSSKLEDAFDGHAMLRLDDEFFLDYRKGTGVYSVGRIDEAARGTPKVVVPAPFHGVREELRRGARVVNLGANRLLEWLPLTGHYRIWSYSLDPARTDIFDPVPVAEGQVPPHVTPNHEILVPAPDRIMFWKRDDGHIVQRVLDPLSPDPFGGAIIGEHRYPQLESPDWTAPVVDGSAIEHLVVVLQQGRSFDSYFGKLCEAAPGDAPTCEEGPRCCEGMPSSIPGADACTPIDPMTDTHVPRSDFTCMQVKVMGGPGAVTAPCGAPADFACAPPGASGAMAFYHQAAANGALADRYFQSTLDGADQNAIYLSKAAFGSSTLKESGFQVNNLMSEVNVKWAVYLASEDDTRDHLAPEFFDHHWDFFRSVAEIDRDVDLEQLPAISIIIPGPTQSERPGAGPAEVGIRLAESIVTRIAASPRYAPRTLVLLTHLTSGGYYDHVAPPPPPDVSLDSREGAPVAYGPRVPLLALGRFARRNHVSHVQLELSSITKFMEWNWRAGETGQLGNRDTIVANIGSLLDPAQTGAVVPSIAP